MSDWNPERYLRFKKERTQPAIDLVMRVKTVNGDITKETFPGVKKMCEEACKYTEKKWLRDTGLQGIRSQHSL